MARVILIAQIRKEIYYTRKINWLSPEEQKGYHKGTIGANDLLQTGIYQPLRNERDVTLT